MSLDGFLAALENTDLGAAVRGDEGWDWLFPNIETAHVLALAVVFGSILMVDLRLLGFSSRDLRVSKLSVEILPYTWVSFALAVITGSVMFFGRAQTYVHNVQFQMKFLCMALAGVNMAVFHRGAYRHVLEWDNRLPTPMGARIAGSCSILLWLAVILFGRWIGFATN